MSVVPQKKSQYLTRFDHNCEMMTINGD